MDRPQNVTYGKGDHEFATACVGCHRKVHFLGEDKDGIRDAIRNSGWKAEPTGIIHPEVGNVAQFRCPECQGMERVEATLVCENMRQQMYTGPLEVGDALAECGHRLKSHRIAAHAAHAADPNTGEMPAGFELFPRFR